MPGLSRTQPCGFSSETEVLANDYSVIVVKFSESYILRPQENDLSAKYIQKGDKIVVFSEEFTKSSKNAYEDGPCPYHEAS